MNENIKTTAAIIENEKNTNPTHLKYDKSIPPWTPPYFETTV